MNNELQYAGEYNLLECKLTTSGGVTIDLAKSNQILEINFNEDIFTNSIGGNIVIVDTHNLITELPIIGQELLSLKLQTPGFTEKRSSLDFTGGRELAIFKIGVRAELSQGSQVYELRFASQELLRNLRVRVSKSYTKDLSDIVEDIMTSDKYIGTMKDLYIEPTQGVRKIVAPNTTPYGLIQDLLKQSVSSEGLPHYLFYENADGFHFRSIQDLYKEAPIKTFHFSENLPETGKHQEPAIIDLTRILNYELQGTNDMIINTTSGMLGSTSIAHDIYSKNYVTKTYGYFEEFDTNTRVSESSNPRYSESTDLNGKTVGNYPDARIMLHPISTKETVDANHMKYAPSKLKDYSSTKNSRILELTTGIVMTMTIPGNTALRVGNVIELDIPLVGVDHSNKKIDRFYNGNFLIKGLRHHFMQSTKTHLTHMSVVKDSVEESIPTAESQALY
jgi:hypothetical protein